MPCSNNTKKALFKLAYSFFHLSCTRFRFGMKKKAIEKKLVILLFLLVFVVFSFAERDSKKLDRLYKTAQLLQPKQPVTVLQPTVSHK